MVTGNAQSKPPSQISQNGKPWVQWKTLSRPWAFTCIHTCLHIHIPMYANTHPHRHAHYTHICTQKKKKIKSGVMAHTFHLGTQEAETGRFLFLWVLGQPGLHRENLSPNKRSYIGSFKESYMCSLDKTQIHKNIRSDWWSHREDRRRLPNSCKSRERAPWD